MRNLVIAIGMAALVVAPLSAQVTTVDPDQALRTDRPRQQAPASPPPAEPDSTVSAEPETGSPPPSQPAPAQAEQTTAATPVNDAARAEADAASARGETFSQSEILSAAEGTFGKGAAGLAGVLERTLKEQGRPSAYIAGREGGGAFAIGLRYGKGDLFHKVEGQQPVYWTGPSIGFDVGGDANKVFVLVYNLYDTEELYKRFPAAEGRLYFVGGFAATYLRRGNVVLIPIRLGVGWRQGVNLGYMKFSHKSRWFPL